MAEELRKSKSELNQKKVVGVKAFEAELISNKNKLHKMVDIGCIDGRREMKIKAMYMEEKSAKEKNLSMLNAEEQGLEGGGGGGSGREMGSPEGQEDTVKVSFDLG